MNSQTTQQLAIITITTMDEYPYVENVSLIYSGTEEFYKTITQESPSAKNQIINHAIKFFMSGDPDTVRRFADAGIVSAEQFIKTLEKKEMGTRFFLKRNYTYAGFGPTNIVNISDFDAKTLAEGGILSQEISPQCFKNIMSPNSYKTYCKANLEYTKEQEKKKLANKKRKMAKKQKEIEKAKKLLNLCDKKDLYKYLSSTKVSEGDINDRH